MPVKLRQPKAKTHRLTPEAIEAFRTGDERALHGHLGLAPWETSPLAVAAGWDCPWPPGTGGAVSWPKALALRAALVEAAADDG